MTEERVTKAKALAMAVEALLHVEGVGVPLEKFNAHVQFAQAWAMVAHAMGPEQFVSFNPDTFVRYGGKTTP